MTDAIHNQDFEQGRHWLQPEHKASLLDIIESSFEGIDAETYFGKYFSANNAFARRCRLYFVADRIIGYCLLTFSRLTIKQPAAKPAQITLMGASAAFLPEYRSGGLTFSYSLKTTLKYWLTHPWQSIVYADTMLSPAMYRATARHLAVVWPGTETTKANIPPYIRDLKQSLIAQSAFKTNGPAPTLLDKDTEDFRLWVGRKTRYTAEEVAGFRTSHKPEFITYCRHNPDFDKGYALLVIIPVNLKQFVKSLIKKLLGR